MPEALFLVNVYKYMKRFNNQTVTTTKTTTLYFIKKKIEHSGLVVHRPRIPIYSNYLCTVRTDDGFFETFSFYSLFIGSYVPALKKQMVT